MTPASDPSFSWLLIGVAGFITVPLVIGTVVISRAPTWLNRRISRVTGAAPSQPKLSDTVLAGSVRRPPVGTILGRMGRKFVASLPHGDVLQARLEQAGICIGVADLVFGWLIIAFIMTSVLWIWSGLDILISLGASFTALTIIPTALIRSRTINRRRRFLSQFPDAVDLIVRGVRSGLPVTEALHAVGVEFHGEVGGLFQDIGASIRLGKSLNEALRMATEKLDVQELRFFATSLAIQQETGGNLGEILSNLSGLMRRRQQLKLKIKAMSSEARASAMIIGSLPFLMFLVIYILDRNYILKLFLDPRGWVLLGAGMTSLMFGLTVMSKMVRFEI